MNQLKIIEDCLQVMDNQDKTIETLQNALYEANYKHTQALDEIAILNNTVDRQHNLIGSFYESLQKSKDEIVILNSTIEIMQGIIDSLCNRLDESKE